VPLRDLERLIYARVEPIIDPLLPQEQAGFRHGRSIIDQVTLLTQDIKDSFRLRRRLELCLSISQQPDTAWHRGLICKLLRLLPDRHTDHMTMGMVGNRSFTLATRNGGAGCDASRTASHRDPSWPPSLQHPTSLTCQTPSPESMMTTYQL